MIEKSPLRLNVKKSPFRANQRLVSPQQAFFGRSTRPEERSPRFAAIRQECRFNPAVRTCIPPERDEPLRLVNIKPVLTEKQIQHLDFSLPIQHQKTTARTLKITPPLFAQVIAPTLPDTTDRKLQQPSRTLRKITESELNIGIDRAPMDMGPKKLKVAGVEKVESSRHPYEGQHSQQTPPQSQLHYRPVTQPVPQSHPHPQTQPEVRLSNRIYLQRMQFKRKE